LHSHLQSSDDFWRLWWLSTSEAESLGVPLILYPLHWWLKPLHLRMVNSARPWERERERCIHDNHIYLQHIIDHGMHASWSYLTLRTQWLPNKRMWW
jgi:hypothetical protein